MPSFDLVSEYDAHEARNSVDQANREVATRFDFKGSNAHYELMDDTITLSASSEFQLQQMRDILHLKLAKRGIDLSCIEVGKVRINGKNSEQMLTLKQGIESVLAKKIVKLIKDKKLKVQAAIQGDKVRVTGKKRDDLQEVMQMLKEQKLEIPLQYNNFRD